MDEKRDKENQNEEITLDTESGLDDSVVAEEVSAETIKKLRAKLKEAEQKSSEYLLGWQRARADFVNYKKREAEEKESFMKYAGEQIMLDVIAVLDSFEMAFADKANWEKADKNWRDGVTLIYNQLKKSLEKNGLSSEEPVGLDFDPMNHMAIAMVETDKSQEGKVVEVLQKGYSLHGRIIRPAKVKVGKVS